MYIYIFIFCIYRRAQNRSEESATGMDLDCKPTNPARCVGHAVLFIVYVVVHTQIYIYMCVCSSCFGRAVGSIDSMDFQISPGWLAVPPVSGIEIAGPMWILAELSEKHPKICWFQSSLFLCVYVCVCVCVCDCLCVCFSFIVYEMMTNI